MCLSQSGSGETWMEQPNMKASDDMAGRAEL